MKTLLKPLLLVFIALFSLLSTQQPVEGQSSITPLQYSDSALQADWQSWQNNFVTTRDAGASPRARVLNGINTTTTYSEGQAYGLLFASIFDDQTLFDGLFLYARDYFNDHGLMNWQIQGTTIIGFGAATDGDVDMAMALLFACDKVETGAWSVSVNGLDYCAEAQTMIQAIWDYEVDHPNTGPDAGLDNNQGYELIPGDYWNLSQEYPNGITNLSYFSPAYFRLFAEFTGNNDWYQVIDRGYEIASLAADNSCAGFVSNWNTYAGAPQEVPWQGYTSEYWGWDAARFAWRVGLDAYWYNDDTAQQAITPIGNFFSSLSIDNLRAQYRLDGTTVNSYKNQFFTSNAAVSIWATQSLQATSCGDADGSLSSNAQQAFTAVSAQQDYTYYSDSWRLLTLLLMSGRFELPFTDGTQPTPTDNPTQIVTTQAPTQVPTQIVTTQAPTQIVTTQAPTQIPTQIVTTQAPTQSGSPIVSNMQAEIWGATDTNNQSQFRIRVKNNGNTPQSAISWRLYFTVEGNYSASDYVLDTYWDSSNVALVSSPIQSDANIYYFDISYGGTLQANAEWEYQGALHLSNWQSDLNTSNDWWKQGGFPSAYSLSSTIPVYINNGLATGVEPGNSIPIPTTVPVSTSVTIPTTVPVSTTVSLPTSVPVSTNVPLPTTVPPTTVPLPTIAPPTTVPISNQGNMSIELLGSTDSNNQAQFRIRVSNNSANPQSGLSWRLYFTVDEGYSASDYVFENYYSSLAGTTVSAPTLASGNIYYFTVATSTPLNANSQWEYQGSIHLANWQDINTSNDYWKQGGFVANYQATTTVPLYINGSVVAGSQPN
ncbi:MAG: hypothetical protein Phog2KO_11820 [Phototrophicaceae bacterium]